MADDSVDALIAKFGGKPAPAAPAAQGVSVDELIAKFGGKPAVDTPKTPPGPKAPVPRELAGGKNAKNEAPPPHVGKSEITSGSLMEQDVRSNPLVKAAAQATRAFKGASVDWRTGNIKLSPEVEGEEEIPGEHTKSTPGKQLARAGHTAFEGGMKALTPEMIAAAVVSPAAAISAVATGTIGKVASRAILEKAGVAEEYAEFLSDLVSLPAAASGPKLAGKLLPTDVGPVLKNKLGPEEREQIAEVERRGIQTTAGQKTGNKMVGAGEKASQYIFGSSGRSQEFFERQSQQTKGALERVPEEIPSYRTAKGPTAVEKAKAEGRLKVPGEAAPPGKGVKVERTLPADRSDVVMESLPERSGAEVQSRLEERGGGAKEFGTKLYNRIQNRVAEHLKTEAPKRYEKDLEAYRKSREQYKSAMEGYGQDVEKYDAAFQNGEPLPTKPVEPVRPTPPRMMKYGAELDADKLRADLKDVYSELDQALPETRKQNSPGFRVLDQLMKSKEPVLDALKFDKDLSAIKSLMRSERSNFAHSKSFRYAAEVVNNAEDQLGRALNKVDPKLNGDLRRARGAWKTYRETDEILNKILPEGKSPRTIFDKLTSPRGVDQPTIDRLKQIAPEALKSVAQASIKGLVEAATEKGGPTRLQVIARRFSTMDNGVKSSLYGKEFSRKLQNFLNGAARLNLEENYSGTAKWRVVTQALGPLGAAFEAFIFGHPGVAAGAVSAPAAQMAIMDSVSRLLFTEKGIHLLTDVIDAPLGSIRQLRAAQEVGKLARVDIQKNGPETPPPASAPPSGTPPPSGGAPSAAGPETPPPGSRPAKPAPKPQGGNAKAAPAQYAPLIEKAAAEYGIESDLLTALLRQESAFNPNAVSKKGAEGIAQFVKGTAKQMGLVDAFNPEEAIPAAAKLLSALRDEFKGDMQLAVAAYNAGAGAVKRVGGDIAKLPEETQNYVKRIFGRLTGERPAVVKSETPPPKAEAKAEKVETKAPAAETPPPVAETKALSPSEEAPPSPESARRPAEEEKPAEARPPERPSLQEGRLTEMPVSEISVDPERFQFKSKAVGRAGVGDKLQDVKTFDPEKGGILAVWKDPEDGKTYIVNGHHRHELATRLGYDKPVPVRQIQAKTDAEARTIGALINIAEGQGEAVDAAKVFRDSKMTPDQIQKEFGLSPRNPLVRLGQQLAKLADGPFKAVVSGDVSEGRGAIIGELLLNPVDQEAAVKISKMADERGRKMTDGEFREVVRLQVARAPRFVETQETLFGTQEEEQNLALERGDVSQYVRQQLASDRQLFKKVADESAGTRLGEEGNTINVKANADRAKMVSQLEALYEKLSTAAGPVSDILDNAAREIADGKPEAAVKRKAYEAIQEAVGEDLRRLLGSKSSGPGKDGVPPSEEPPPGA